MLKFSPYTMLISFFLIFMQMSVCFGNDLLSKFKQNDYKTKDFRIEVETYDKEVVRFLEVKTFKHNRTTVAFNGTVNFKIDLKDNLEALVQGYKFASNEFRDFPMRFQVNAVKVFEANVLGVQKITQCGNMTNFYILKDITYHVCNFVMDDTHLPPLMPSGRYKASVHLVYFEKQIALLNLYGEIYRPIKLPKKRN